MSDLLQEEYNWAKSIPTDIFYHLDILNKLASKVDHVTEFGVRTGMSSRAFLASTCILRSYDLELDPRVQQLFDHASSIGKDVKYIKGDTLTIDIEDTDLLFIDTDHTYKQLKQELDIHHSKVIKYLAFHDTTTFAGPNTQDKYGMVAALLEFLAEHKEWQVIYHTPLNNGFTILERIH